MAGVAGVAAGVRRPPLCGGHSGLPGAYLGDIPLSGLTHRDVQAMFTAIIRDDSALGLR